ncbi:MAG: peptide deformylase [Candidatus Omnitrophota bacterium]|nr:peptide deformylase [Candidatus Omnitrophota bacterium]
MDTTTLKIRILGDPVLRRKAACVKKVTAEHCEILKEMCRLMYESSGIGLAAPQVGISEAMIVVDIGSGLYKLINPRVIKREGHQAIEEGCLSVPGISIKVKRAKKILLSAIDETGSPVTVKAEDLLACVFQHEIGHLQGKLIVDYANFFDKIKIAKKMKSLKERPKSAALPKAQTKSGKLQL